MKTTENNEKMVKKSETSGWKVKRKVETCEKRVKKGWEKRWEKVKNEKK